MRFLRWLFLLPFALSAQVNKPGDFQIWARTNLNVPFHAQWEWNSTWEYRFGDDASKMFYTYFQSQVFYRPVKWVSISPGYRQGWLRFPVDASVWKPQYYPLFEIIPFCEFGGWTFWDRNRVAYAIYDSDPSHWVYRNRFRLTTPAFAYESLNWFVENEVFFRQVYGFDEDRAGSGFTLYRRNRLNGEIYYLARFLKYPGSGPGTGWRHFNCLVMSFNANF